MSNLRELLKIYMTNSKGSPTLFGKSVEKVKKGCNFHEIMPKFPKIESTFEVFSQSFLKLSKADF